MYDSRFTLGQNKNKRQALPALVTLVRDCLKFRLQRSEIIEIIDIECVLGNLAGTQIEKKIALINPPCWICPRSGLCELQWGEFNLPL